MLITICQTFTEINRSLKPNMSSATKTLELLGYFSVNRPEIGLSQFCRLAGRDKATTYRHLRTLEDTGFIEQNPLNKRYRLGPALLQLAQTRELTVPRKSGAEPALKVLANATGETTHVSVLSGTVIYPLLSCESDVHSTRVIIDVQTTPLHATASGLCVLAFGPDELLDVASVNMTAFTDQTLNSRAALEDAIQGVRETGFGRTDRSFEDEVSSLSAPIFDQTGLLVGAVSVACVASRFTPAFEAGLYHPLVLASRTITQNWGGEIPEYIEAAWAKALSASHALETAS